jgi:hypothetical protein
MSVLTRPRSPLIDAAIDISRDWCEGHIIDGSPALGHALKVARKVGELVASAADKVVSIAAITLRARRSGDPAAFWSRRRAFIDRVPYFQAFAVAAEPHLPASLVRDLAAVITSAVEATTAAALFAWSQPGCAARHAPDR